MTFETGTSVSPLFTVSGMSRRSFTLSAGIITVVMPPRSAASSFSFKPPIGSTLPLSVTSPVIATSRRTGMPVSTDTIEVTMAMPADGPSFGVAPSGTCTWMSIASNIGGFSPSSGAFDRTHEEAASINSFITSPSLPVVFIRPLPGSFSASIDSRSPPTSVQASPVTAPTWSVSSASPYLNRCTPRYSSRFSRRDHHRRGLALDDLGHRLAAELGDLALEVPHARPRGCSSARCRAAPPRSARTRPASGRGPSPAWRSGACRAMPTFSSSV